MLLAAALGTPEGKKGLKRALHAKRRDMRRFDGCPPAELAALLSILAPSDGLCPDCGVPMLFTGWAPFCLRQFSPDRLDNRFGHVAGNLRFCCFNCNATPGWSSSRACLKGCHAGYPEGVERIAAPERSKREQAEGRGQVIPPFPEGLAPLRRRTCEPSREESEALLRLQALALKVVTPRRSK